MWGGKNCKLFRSNRTEKKEGVKEFPRVETCCCAYVYTCVLFARVKDENKAFSVFCCFSFSLCFLCTCFSSIGSIIESNILFSWLFPSFTFVLAFRRHRIEPRKKIQFVWHKNLVVWRFFRRKMRDRVKPKLDVLCVYKEKNSIKINTQTKSKLFPFHAHDYFQGLVAPNTQTWGDENLTLF